MVLWGTSCSEHTDDTSILASWKWQKKLWYHFHGNVSQHFWAFIGDFFSLVVLFLSLLYTFFSFSSSYFLCSHPRLKTPSPHLGKEFCGPSLYWNDSSRSSRTETRVQHFKGVWQQEHSSSEKNTFCSLFNSVYSFLSCNQSFIHSPWSVSATH